MNAYPQKRKAVKPNGFFIFALEFKKRLLCQGHDLHNIRQVMEMAAPHWEKLKPEEKEEYKMKSKFSDVDMSVTQSRKRKRLNCVGNDIDELQESLNIQHETYGKMVAEIKNLVTDASDLGELDTKVFYFISTTSFIDNVKDVFPAELAMAKFSLKEGIIDDMHIQINPGELPLGSFGAAKQKSTATHRYQLPPDCKGETDYLLILEAIVKFLHPLDKLPIFFTEGNTRDDKIPLNETCKIVDKIFYDSEEDEMMTMLKIYPIEELLFIMQKVTSMKKRKLNGTFDQAFPSIVYAANCLKTDEYRYTTKGCEFHNEEDVADHCCVSKVRRYGYTIAKWCADGKRYELKPGKHFPSTHDCFL